MKLIYRIASLIKWTAISYFAIPESIFRASQIQCEEWISNVETDFAQIIANTPGISFSPTSFPEKQPLIKFSGNYKLAQR